MESHVARTKFAGLVRSVYMLISTPGGRTIESLIKPTCSPDGTIDTISASLPSIVGHVSIGSFSTAVELSSSALVDNCLREINGAWNLRDRYLCAWKNDPIPLTVTEYLLIKALASNPGHVKSRDQLIEAAYGETIYVDDRTIDSHIKRVRQKFKKTDPEFDRIEAVYGAGYKFSES